MKTGDYVGDDFADFFADFLTLASRNRIASVEKKPSGRVSKSTRRQMRANVLRKRDFSVFLNSKFVLDLSEKNKQNANKNKFAN